MYCKKCGTQNEDNAWKCVKCGETIQGAAKTAAPAEKIPNYLVQAILTTVFCCLPLGIVAIVFAAQVNTKIGAGDIEGAKQSSKNAKVWSWVSFGAGLLGAILYALFVGLAIFSARGAGNF